MTRVDVNIYKDVEGDEITEYTSDKMRLRTCMQYGVKIFNFEDIKTLQSYDAEEVFNFLQHALGDELFNYLDMQTKYEN